MNIIIIRNSSKNTRLYSVYSQPFPFLHIETGDDKVQNSRDVVKRESQYRDFFLKTI